MRENGKQKYMRATEVAKYLSIAKSTVWLYVKQGKLHPKKISSRVTVFSLDEIEDFLNYEEVKKAHKY